MAEGFVSRLLSAAFLACMLTANGQAQHNENNRDNGAHVPSASWFFSGGPLNDHVPAEIGYETGNPFFIWDGKIEPHYFWKPVRPISGNTLKLRYEIEVLSGVPELRVVEEIPESYDPKISIVIQRRGDQWTGRGRYDFYRWYKLFVGPLTPGGHEVTVSLDDGKWVSVFGKKSAGHPAEFRDALRDSQYIGLGFGGHFAAHGVTISGGSVKFSIREWTVF